MLRVATGVGYERALATPLLRAGAQRRLREFVMRDVDGNVDKVRVDLSANPGLLEALNTTAGRDTRSASRRSRSRDGEEPSA